MALLAVQGPQIRKLWYIYTMEYYSAIKKNTFESVLMRWMKLEPIIQSEVSQKEKHQYSISEVFVPSFFCWHQSEIIGFTDGFLVVWEMERRQRSGT